MDSGSYVYSYKGKGLNAPKKRGPGKFFLFLVIVFIAVAGVWFFRDKIFRKSTPTKADKSVKKIVTRKKPTGKKTQKPPVKSSSKYSITYPPITNTEPPPEIIKTVKKPITVKKPPVKPKSEKDKALEKKLAILCKKGEAALKKQEYDKARKMARVVMDSGITEENPLWQYACNILNKCSAKIITTDVPVREKVLYTIKPGDSLDQIARRFNTTVETIRKSNNLNADQPFIHPGNQLRIFKGNWRVKVSKKKFKLYLYNDDELFKVYGIGIGRQNRTPVGSFIIVDKVVEPDWEYRGKKYPFGTKENILGTRWMRLRPTGNTDQSMKGYGIHGTWEADSIGKAMSNGCIRMLNEEINELFAILPKYRNTQGKYTEVIIE